MVHRDLKPDSVIVDKQGKATLIDFSLDARFTPEQKLERLCGAFQFNAPVIFGGIAYDVPKVDM